MARKKNTTMRHANETMQVWLDRHRGLVANVITGPLGTFKYCGFPGGGTAIILIYPDGNGWDIFTPLRENNIRLTLADAEKRLGLGS